MKRIICASVLLGLGAIMLPLMFTEKGSALTADSPPPLEPPLESTLPSTSPTPAVIGGGDGDMSFSLLRGEEVVQVTMAEHLPQVLAGEMPVSFQKEALEAQAVAARSYIVYCTKHKNPKHKNAAICDQAGCCLAAVTQDKLRAAWGESYDANMKVIDDAASNTDGTILKYQQEPILASFHSSSAGKTEAGSELWGDVPYLVSVNSPETADDVPDFVTSVEVSEADFKESLLLLEPEASFGEDVAGWLGETVFDDSGRVKSILIGGRDFSGSELRKLFTLRSTCFKVERKNGAFVFTVTGFGHGLGLSQYGANVMAKNGFTHQEILAHYYPETQLCGY